MTAVIVTGVLYFVILGLFAYYAWLNVKQTRTLQEWNDKTEVEIKAIRERNLELELRVKKMETDLGMSVIKPEPDVKFTPRKEALHD